MSSRAKAVVVLIAVLLAGCLIGIWGFDEWTERSGGDRGGFSSRQPDVEARFARRLELSSEQQKQLNEILEESRRQIDTTRAEMGKKFDEIRAATNTKIAAILTEEQKKKFEQLLKEAEAHGRADPGDEGHGRRSGH
jgi:Spy/CpxP family protein refolding chaperone